MNKEEVYEALLAYVSTVLKPNDAAYELNKVVDDIKDLGWWVPEEEGRFLLDACLTWDKTDQGFDFWVTIYAGNVPEEYKDAYNV